LADAAERGLREGELFELRSDEAAAVGTFSLDYAGTDTINSCRNAARFWVHDVSAVKFLRMSTVLVTGGSGFVGSYCILQLLAAGYAVRTTLRDLRREGDVRAMLKEGGAEPGSRLSFMAADLEKDDGWRGAVAGCEYVLHVASPLPSKLPKNEGELIMPAREGALRVLRASREAGVKRVVLTSSFAAIGYGQKPQQTPFNETNWTDPDSDITAYTKSKTLTERAAWDFMAK
jgi:nucleoside-diphosphate-sugar epimerase